MAKGFMPVNGGFTVYSGNSFETLYNPQVIGLQVGDLVGIPEGYVGAYVFTWESYDRQSVFLKMYSADGSRVIENLEFSTATGDDLYVGFEDPYFQVYANGTFDLNWKAIPSGAVAYDSLSVFYNFPTNSASAIVVDNTGVAFDAIVPKEVYLQNGGSVLVWADSGATGDGGVDTALQINSPGVIGQLYDAGGNKVGGRFVINSTTDDYQGAPDVVALEDGGFVAVWESLGQDGSGTGVYGQRFAADGSKSGGEFQVNTYTQDNQDDPSVAALADGGFVVTWSSFEQDGSFEGIYAQRYNFASEKVGGETRINQTTQGVQHEASVAGLAEGGFVVTWTTKLGNGIGDSVVAYQYEARQFGFSGDDVIVDNKGINWIDGMKGNDVIQGLKGNDTLLGSGGNDALMGGKGHDKLLGGKGSDELDGGNGDDVLKGQKGKDTLDGDVGDDVLSGGKGQDVFVFKLGYGSDQVSDFKDDVDTLNLSTTLWAGGLDQQGVVDAYAQVVGGTDIVFTFDQGDTLTLKGFTDLTALANDIVFV